MTTAVLLLAINLRPVVNAVGAVIPELRESTGLPASTTGLLLSLPTLSFAVLGLAAPALAARIGSHRTVVLCLLAAVAYAGGVVAQKPALGRASALQVTTFGCLVGAVLCLPFAGQLVREAATAPASATLNVVYLGVFPTAQVVAAQLLALAVLGVGFWYNRNVTGKAAS